MPIPIYDALNKHINKKMSSFHTPGHKSFAVNENYSFFFDNMINYDLTELPDTDNLLEHNGAIKESETKASRLFGSGLSLYSTFGCTLCIQTMIKLASMRSKKIIADRSIHKSAVNAMALLDMEPVWVYPEKNGRINPQEIKRLIKTNKEAKVVYITSPNYYGLIQDIDKIADICHKNDCILLVDNAHGSHLYFTDEDLDKSLQKADLVACSLHKTLPVMTAGAVLNINNKQYIKAAAEAMRLFSGTSPSYPILVSIDLCIDYLTKQKRYFLRDIAEKVKKLKHIAKQSGLLNDSSAMLDPLRLTLNTEMIGISGFELAKMMRKFKIEPETEDAYNVILIFGVCNSDEDFKRVCEFLQEVKSLVKEAKKKPESQNLSCNFKAERKLSLRQALLSDFEEVCVSDALNKTAYDSVCKYPPGIPFLLPGELITDKTIKMCKENLIETIKVVV